VIALVRALAEAGEVAVESPPERAIEAVAAAAQAGGGLVPGDREVLVHVARATLAPRTLDARHLSPLRAAGLDDRAIHDVVHVAACFAYMNRLADSLGVAVVGDDRRAWAARLLGDEALRRHDRWAAGSVRGP